MCWSIRINLYSHCNNLKNLNTLFYSISKSWMSCNNSTNIKRWFFVIFFICLMRAFSAFRAITFFACTSFRFIRQNFMNWALTRFFSSSFSFCNFAMMTCFAFSLMNFKLFVSNRRRLRKNFFLFSSFCLVVYHICNFVSLKNELIIIFLMLLMKFRNFSSRTKSLHCILSAILRFQWFFSSCWISVKSRVWRNSDNVNFVVSTCFVKML
jgi:hypothetical protein